MSMITVDAKPGDIVVTDSGEIGQLMSVTVCSSSNMYTVDCLKPEGEMICYKVFANTWDYESFLRREAATKAESVREVFDRELKAKEKLDEEELEGGLPI